MELGRDYYAIDWFFLAMAHWQLRHKDEARTWFDKAVAWMERYDPNDGAPSASEPRRKPFWAEIAPRQGIARIGSFNGELARLTSFSSCQGFVLKNRPGRGWETRTAKRSISRPLSVRKIGVRAVILSQPDPGKELSHDPAWTRIPQPRLEDSSEPSSSRP